MILVSVGTNGSAFDRLLRELDNLSTDEDVIVQRGPSCVAPAGATCVDYLPFPEFERLLSNARVVVCHAGVGSTLTALARGHRPIVVPRLRQFGEAVDDHQLEFARRLDHEGLVECVRPSEIPAMVDGGRSTVFSRFATAQPAALVSDLSRYLAQHCRPRAGVVAGVYAKTQ